MKLLALIVGFLIGLATGTALTTVVLNTDAKQLNDQLDAQKTEIESLQDMYTQLNAACQQAAEQCQK